jgi:predicted nucleic acid-binding protein
MENRRRMRVLLDTKAEKFDLTIVSFDSNFNKTDLVRKNNLKY